MYVSVCACVCACVCVCMRVCVCVCVFVYIFAYTIYPGNGMVFKNLQNQNDYYCKHLTGCVSLFHQNLTKILTWTYLSVAGFFLRFIPTTFPTVFCWDWVDAISLSLTRTVHSTSRSTFTPWFPCSPSRKDKGISEGSTKIW